MQTRVFRFFLIAVLVAASVGGVLWTWTLAQHVEQLEQTGRQTATRIDRLEALLDELSRDELAYLTSGAVDHEALTTAGNRLQQLAYESSLLLGQMVAGTAPAAGAVAQSLDDITKVETNARESLRAGLDEAASALVFTDSARTRQRLREQLRALRAVESASVADARSQDLRQAWIVLGVVALLFAASLVRSARVGARRPPIDSDAQALETTAVPKQSHHSVASPGIDLGETAAVCTAMAQLQSESALPELLSRAAQLLGAPGIVVWMGAGDELFPVAGYGYSRAQWERLGAISRSDLNATAAAWRMASLQTVAADSSARAAVVAPMLGADRCVGVLAVEIPSGRESERDTQAIIALLAAQLVGVLVAWPAASALPDPGAVSFEQVSASTG